MHLPLLQAFLVLSIVHDAAYAFSNTSWFSWVSRLDGALEPLNWMRWIPLYNSYVFPDLPDLYEASVVALQVGYERCTSSPLLD